MQIRRRTSLSFVNYGKYALSITLLFSCSTLGDFLSIRPLVAQQLGRTTNTTVCDIASHPERFDGKIVRVKARIESGIEVFGIVDPLGKCKELFLLAYPDEADASRSQIGSTIKRIPVELRKDKQFELFEKYAHAEINPRFDETHCSHCMRYGSPLH